MVERTGPRTEIKVVDPVFWDRVKLWPPLNQFLIERLYGGIIAFEKMPILTKSRVRFCSLLVRHPFFAIPHAEIEGHLPTILPASIPQPVRRSGSGCVVAHTEVVKELIWPLTIPGKLSVCPRAINHAASNRLPHVPLARSCRGGSRCDRAHNMGALGIPKVVHC